MTDWKAVRDQFPALGRWTYLNTATFGQLSRRTTEAVVKHFGRRDEQACSDFLTWFDDADEIRGLIARLIECDATDVAFFPNASTPLSLLAGAIDWREGDRVMTLEDEFPNHLYWGQSLIARGVFYDEVTAERMIESITPRTRLVMMSTVNYTNGLRPPLEKLSRACRDNGALLYIDGTQSVGALRFSFRDIQPDMFATDGYKWMLSPNGAGFAAIHPRVRDWLQPALVGWRSDKRWREVNSLHHGAPEFKSEAERYEGGMLSFPVIYGMAASIELMLELGTAEIEKRVLSLAGQVRDRVRGLGATAPDYDSGIVAARWPGRDSWELAKALRERRIHVAARHGNLRISTHFYNVEQDIDVLIGALRAIL